MSITYILFYVFIYLIVMGVLGYIESELPGSSSAKTVIQMFALFWSVAGTVWFLWVTWSAVSTICALLLGFLAFDAGKDKSLAYALKKTKEAEEG